MKIKYSYILITISLLTGSCAKEEALPVTVDFSIDVFNEDYSVPVDIVIFNNTEGAETFEWTFEGGIPSSSIEKNPGIVRYVTKGNYTIKLYASNADGSEGTKEIEVKIDDPVVIDFSANVLTDNFAPAEVQIENNTTGATSYKWFFEGGIPETSEEKNPRTITFNTPGEHTIRLEASNGLETETLEKTITVAPFLVSDFDFEIAFEDDDLQVPVKVSLQNKSVSATSYRWSFTGASIENSTEENPEVIFTEPGLQTITLEATNGKETKTVAKELTFFTNTNLRVFEDIRLGINSAHTGNTVGAFFSIKNRTVYTAEQITSEIIPDIDLVFFGLNQNFVQNSFVSPDGLEETTFPVLQGANKTKFINNIESCNCSANLTDSQFINMRDDNLLRELSIEETAEGLQPFDDSIVPRIVLFETIDGEKGAIKIKEYIKQGNNSYILIDIKTQKEKL